MRRARKRIPCSHTTHQLWRIARFSNGTSPEGAPGDDPDGDTGDNNYEWLTNTNPNGRSSYWRPVLRHDGADVFLDFAGLGNRRVNAFHSADLVNRFHWAFTSLLSFLDKAASPMGVFNVVHGGYAMRPAGVVCVKNIEKMLDTRGFEGITPCILSFPMRPTLVNKGFPDISVQGANSKF